MLIAAMMQFSCSTQLPNAIYLCLASIRHFLVAALFHSNYPFLYLSFPQTFLSLTLERNRALGYLTTTIETHYGCTTSLDESHVADVEPSKAGHATLKPL